MFVALVQANKRQRHFSGPRNGTFFCNKRKFVFVFCSVFWHQRRNGTQAKNTRINRWQIRHFGSLFPFQFLQPEASCDRRGQPRRISRQKFPKRTRILSIPSKPYSFHSVHSVHSAIGSRMNGMIFRSFRKRNSSQKNTNTVYSEYSHSGIVPKERTLNKLEASSDAEESKWDEEPVRLLPTSCVWNLNLFISFNSYSNLTTLYLLTLLTLRYITYNSQIEK